MYVEKLIDGKWVAQGNFSRNEDGWIDGGMKIYDGRNYDLFAMLADVRNGRGFAGCKTGEGFNPIAEPKGIPDDASDEFKAIAEQWGCDGHSHSYLTLRELLDYDWTQETGKQGWLSIPEWEQWSRWNRNRGHGPNSYCGFVIGGAVRHISAEDADALFKDVAWADRERVAAEHPSTYAQATWGTPYYRAAGQFMDEAMSKLLKLAGGSSGIDDVRIVFFFDN
ncbi:hypothetical protein [Burkholderia vietnamiensis]|uniref:hypothetical protein n=1 Tax=Burkholderia vietnamiensis TaxID=60552 RepID=UPI0018DE90A1|nr:hypothetical protein [Burkholderia vietnamiensis]MBH9645074.1 hypothetical protein [Burkholderia vietnamiensis]